MACPAVEHSLHSCRLLTRSPFKASSKAVGNLCTSSGGGHSSHSCPLCQGTWDAFLFGAAGPPMLGWIELGSSGRKLLERHQQHPWARCSHASRDLMHCQSHCLLERNWGRGQEWFFGGEAGSLITGMWRWSRDGRRGPEKRTSYGDCTSVPLRRPSKVGRVLLLPLVCFMSESHKALKFRRKWHFCYPRRVESFYLCPDSVFGKTSHKPWSRLKRKAILLLFLCLQSGNNNNNHHHNKNNNNN